MIKITHGFIFILTVSCSMLGNVSAAFAAPSTLDLQAKKILTQSCFKCHGQNGEDQGGYGSVLDFDGLESQGIIKPGKPAESLLLQRVKKGEMPPGRGKLSAESVSSLEKWISSRAAVPAQGPVVTAPVPREDEILSDMFVDLATVDRDEERFIRYISLNHLANEGLGENILKQYESTLGFLLNSLSFEQAITAPKAVNAKRTVFRIDMRDYGWDSDRWDALVEAYPYSGLASDNNARVDFLATATGSKVFAIRADWFIENASRAPLYYRLLGVQSEGDLLGFIGIDMQGDIDSGHAPRAGFGGSGVSHNNRVIERHNGKFGYYWRSYDFKDSIDSNNVFLHPLDFTPTAGEAIFSLPNGLQGYLVVNGAGTLVDKADTTIVSDVHRPDRAVIPGLSCMGCHGAVGIIPKDDQVRALFSQSYPGASATTTEQVLKLYVPKERFAALVQKDGRGYQKSIAALNLNTVDENPVTVQANAYESKINLDKASAELDLTSEQLRGEIAALPSAAGVGILGSLVSPGGSVPRDAFENSFQDLVRARRNYLGGLTAQNRLAGALKDLRKQLIARVALGFHPRSCALLCGAAEFDVLRSRYQTVISDFDDLEDLDAAQVITALTARCSEAIRGGRLFTGLSFDLDGKASLLAPDENDAGLVKGFCELKR